MNILRRRTWSPYAVGTLIGVLSWVVFLGDHAIGVSTATWAQGRQAGATGKRIYDPRTVETVTGEVVSVEHVTPAEGRSGGVHVTLKTDGETLPVHLGPAWYVDHQDVRVGRGDRVEVEGSRVSVEGKPAIIARQVKKGGETLTLRNATGVPAWAGQRGKRRP